MTSLFLAFLYTNNLHTTTLTPCHQLTDFGFPLKNIMMLFMNETAVNLMSDSSAPSHKLTKCHNLTGVSNSIPKKEWIG